jgi:DNA polymerase III epsilon subunit family exonuclease
MAAALLRRVLPGYLGAQVQDFGTESEPPVVVALGETTYPTSAHIRLVSDQSASGGFTVTARAYRLCQLVLMRYEHLAAGRFVVFDVETTSNRSETAEILDIGAVVVEDGKVTGRTFGTLVRPSSAEAITLDAANVHGLGWDHVRNAPAPVDVLARFLEFAGDATLVGHNIQRFDFPVLARACDRAGLDSPRNLLLDTLLLARRLRPGMLNALDDLLTPSELQARRGRHEALLDAGLTAQVFVRLLNHLGREKEIDVLTEELPVVAASIHARNAESTPDNMLLASIGARAHRFGMGQHPPSEPVTWLAQVEYTHLVEQLRKSDPGNEPDDNAWERLRAGWRDVVGTFEATLRDQTLEGLIEFVALATPSDLDSGDAERISMMSVYSAKGHEWPVVFLIGVEDDQYPFSSNAQENEVEEGRRALYVGMTRAGDRLILTWARVVDGKPRAPSRFLADMQGHVAFHERSRSVHA